jgi:hypothetical protein
MNRQRFRILSGADSLAVPVPAYTYVGWMWPARDRATAIARTIAKRNGCRARDVTSTAGADGTPIWTATLTRAARPGDAATVRGQIAFVLDDTAPPAP